MEIRPPHKPNYPAIADMLSSALGQGWDAERLAGQVMADPHFDPNLVLMAREKGEVLGFLSSVIADGQAWVKLIAVVPGRQRQGLGKEMLERIEERASGEGARSMRAGFSPPAQFFPGVPEGVACDFFRKLGYRSSPGGLVAGLVAEAKAAAKPDPKAAHILMKACAPEWWGDVEERLTFDSARLSLSSDGKALCLADPGQGIGPLFFSEAPEASIREAVLGALVIGAPRLRDSRPMEWWKQRFELEHPANCFGFEKELKGVFHA